MGKLWWLGLAAFLAASPGLGAEQGAGAVRDYEAQLEQVSKEIREIRRETESLVQELVEGETGRVFLFLEGPAAGIKEVGASVTVDGKAVLSRAFTAAEQDVLGRGLPLQLVDLRLPAGEHKVTLAPLGVAAGKPASLRAERGKVSSWVAKSAGAGLEWRAE